jgi:hypothetical protein
VTAPHDPSEQELRDRLAAIDPQRVGSPERSALSEEAMAARVEEAVMSTTRTDAEEAPTLDERGPGWRRPWLAAAAAAVVLAGVGVAVLVTGGDDDRPGTVTAGPGQTLELALPDPALSMSCLMFDVSVLADMSPAFAATATAVTEEQVVLEVEKWYAGTPAQRDAELVTLARPNPATSAALDGVAFEQGETYLVTAADGVVNGCGFSGPATPELRAAFEEAFAG